MREPTLAETANVRVTAAKKLLGAKCNVASIEAAVWTLLVREERHKNLADRVRKPTNGAEKKAIKRVIAEADRLASALNDADLPTFVAKQFPSYSELKARVVDLRFIVAPKLKGGRFVALGREAVMHASALMEEHGLERAATRGAKYDQLAMALCGRDKSLSNYLSLYGDVSFLDTSD